MTPRLLLAPVVAATATTGLRTVLDARTGPAWRRANYRGSTVTLSLGPAAVAGLLAGIAVGGGASHRIPLAAGLCVAGAGVAGFLDDRASADEHERAVKGFAGHLGALARGSASAGTTKMVVVGATSLAAAAIRVGATSGAVIDGALVAGCANLVNLLDLRPGRALKVTGVAAVALLPAAGTYGGVAMTVAATVAAALPADLGERSMLGDTGANALGAAVGTLLCGRGRRVRLGALATVVALTALSEKVSFSTVISGHPLLRKVDELGRRHG